MSAHTCTMQLCKHCLTETRIGTCLHLPVCTHLNSLGCLLLPGCCWADTAPLSSKTTHLRVHLRTLPSKGSLLRLTVRRPDMSVHKEDRYTHPTALYRTDICQDSSICRCVLVNLRTSVIGPRQTEKLKSACTGRCWHPSED